MRRTCRRHLHLPCFTHQRYCWCWCDRRFPCLPTPASSGLTTAGINRFLVLYYGQQLCRVFQQWQNCVTVVCLHVWRLMKRVQHVRGLSSYSGNQFTNILGVHWSVDYDDIRFSPFVDLNGKRYLMRLFLSLAPCWNIYWYYLFNLHCSHDSV